jgi:hypothetical protein
MHLRSALRFAGESTARRLRPWLVALPWLLLAAPTASAQQGTFEISPGERVVFIGNTFAERMQIFPHFEALLTALHPERRLTFRYLAWSGDEVALRPRPLNFGDLHTHLAEQGADVIFAAFGMNESYGGREALPRFREQLGALLDTLTSRAYNGAEPARVVLLSPIPHETVDRVPLDPSAHNGDLALYTDAMREAASAAGVRFVDLFHPLQPLTADPALGDLTINGIHLDDRGYEIASRLIARSLGWLPPEASLLESSPAGRGRLTEAVRRKNELFFFRWRAVNGEYIYGRRKEPFGVVNFPAEMAALEEMISAAEREIWMLAGARASRQTTP